jgi:hypothetical protein
VTINHILSSPSWKENQSLLEREEVDVSSISPVAVSANSLSGQGATAVNNIHNEKEYMQQCIVMPPGKWNSKMASSCEHSLTRITVASDSSGAWPRGFSWTLMKDGTYRE